MKKELLKRLGVGIIAGIMCVGFLGCGNSSSKNSLEKIKEKGTLVVGTSADYPPYEFHKKDNGEDKIVGFDIDIAQQIADDMGVKLEIKDMDFDGLLVSSQAGKIDLVIAGMNPTPEREENADFSDVYYKAENLFIVKKGEEGTIKNSDDLKGKKVGVQKGTVQETYAKETLKDSELKSLAKVTDLILDLDNDKIDAILVNTPVAEANCTKNEKLGMSEYKIEDMEAGAAIAMKKNSEELKEAVNSSIKKLKDENKIDEYVKKANELAEDE